MSVPVKCLYCGEKFKKEEVEYVQISRRYAHKACAEAYEKGQTIQQQTYQLALQWLGSSLNTMKYNQQYKKMIEEGKTPEGIHQALQYWIEIKKGSPEKANGGIAILDFIYAEACQYYKNQERNKQLNKDVDYEQLKNVLSNSTKIKIKPTPIAKPKRIKFFKLN